MKTFFALLFSGTVLATLATLATLGCSGSSSSRTDAGSGGSVGAGGAASGGALGTGGAASGGALGTGGAAGAGGHGGDGGAGAAAGRGGTAGASLDGGAACSTPDPVPDGGVRCGSSSLCDPPHPDGGVCNSVPPINAATTSFTIWVDDSTAPGGGWRVTLAASTPVTAGGHSYQDMREGLVGSGGNGIYGDLYVARDGQAKWTGFHLEGWPIFHGGGVWDWPATLTVARAGEATPAVVGRHYTISRAASSCPGGSSATYTFTAEEPARACAFGIDLLSITFSGS